jgi:3-dehydroquinate synthase
MFYTLHLALFLYFALFFSTQNTMLPDNIRFTDQPQEELTRFLQEKKYSQVALLADENTHTHCYPRLEKSLPPHSLLTVPAGEEHKTLDTCITIWQAMTDKKLDRHAALIVLGGGVLGDMGGFCAATYKRGIDFILVPTTLLSQVDASIGGKLGVDFNHFKNHIGVFQLPALTLLCSPFLKSLPESELRSGYAEVIKHILISDASLWNTIKTKSLNEQDWPHLIRHSVAFKASVVTEDPREKGLRKILNTGHTIGHAFESYFIALNKRYLHGEAIAVGIIAEAFISRQRGLLTIPELDSIKSYLLSIYGKLPLTKDDIEEISKLVIQDKKNKGNKILCVLLDGIGRARWDEEISLEEVKEALSFYQAL